MNHQQLILFFLQIGTMLSVALVCGQLMRKIHQPAVLGELLGGIVLGPTVFGLLAPELSAWFFPTEGLVAFSLDAVLKIGMLFFLFVAGLEVKLRGIHQKRGAVAMTSLFGVLLPFGLGFGAVVLWPGWWGTGQVDIFLLALFIGAALSISALPVRSASPRPVPSSASASRSTYGRRSKNWSGSAERRSPISSHTSAPNSWRFSSCPKRKKHVASA